MSVEERVDAPGDDLGDAVGGREFALGRDGGEQPRGVPAVALGVEQAADDRTPRGVSGELAPAVFAERGDGRRAVPGGGVLVGGVQVAGHERGRATRLPPARW